MEIRFTQKQIEAIKNIRNFLMHKGRTPSIRELMGTLGYRSPKSVQDILVQLQEKGVIKKMLEGDYQFIHDPQLGDSHALTVNVPLVGTVACGTPILAEQNIEGYVPVSTTLAHRGSIYYLLHASGDSMDELGINDGDLVLVRQQPTALKGEPVVALIDDEATIKEFYPEKDVVVLKPRSTNKKHRPIILHSDFQIQGVVVATIPNFKE